MHSSGLMLLNVCCSEMMWRCQPLWVTQTSVLCNQHKSDCVLCCCCRAGIPSVLCHGTRPRVVGCCFLHSWTETQCWQQLVWRDDKKKTHNNNTQISLKMVGLINRHRQLNTLDTHTHSKTKKHTNSHTHSLEDPGWWALPPAASRGPNDVTSLSFKQTQHTATSVNLLIQESNRNFSQ